MKGGILTVHDEVDLPCTDKLAGLWDPDFVPVGFTPPYDVRDIPIMELSIGDLRIITLSHL